MVDLSQGKVVFTLGIDDTFTASPDIFKSQETMIDCYEELIAKAIIERAHQRDTSITAEHQEKVFPHIKYILEWLRNTDFYTAPASIKYHDACVSGLLTHTLTAYNQLVGLRGVPKFKSVVDDQWYSAVFVMLVHDWCKIGRYESYLKNVKNEAMDTWEKVPAFKYKEDGTGRFGHGTQSLIMAMQVCTSKYTSLSFEEMASIRWHMDNWDMSNYDVEDLHRCNEKVPMVRMIQFADQLAITTY